MLSVFKSLEGLEDFWQSWSLSESLFEAEESWYHKLLFQMHQGLQFQAPSWHLRVLEGPLWQRMEYQAPPAQTIFNYICNTSLSSELFNPYITSYHSHLTVQMHTHICWVLHWGPAELIPSSWQQHMPAIKGPHHQISCYKHFEASCGHDCSEDCWLFLEWSLSPWIMLQSLCQLWPLPLQCQRSGSSQSWPSSQLQWKLRVE